MSNLPSRESMHSPESLVERTPQGAALALVGRAYASRRLADREAMIKGTVTATGDTTLHGHGKPGPWAFVTIYGDFEIFDTVLVLEVDDG